MYFYSGLLGILEVITKRKYICLYVVFSFMIFLMAGFRDCGFDYGSYEDIFNSINLSSNWYDNVIVFNVEPIYGFINYLMTSYRILLIFMSGLTFTLFFIFTYKYSPYPFLSVNILLLTFVYQQGMGQIRQALAISIILWAFIACYNSKRLLCAVLVLISSLIHAPAMLALLVFIVPFECLSIRNYSLIGFVALLVNFFGLYILPSFIPFLPNFISLKLSIYLEAEVGMSVGFDFSMLLRVLFFTLLLWKKDFFSNNSLNAFFMNLYFISLVVYLGFGFLPQLGGRGSLYFNILEGVVLAMLISSFRYWSNKFIMLTLFLLISIYRHTTLFEAESDYNPYKTVLFNLENIQ